MRINFQFKTIGLLLCLMSMTGCSVVDSYRTPEPQAKSLPKIPEIRHQSQTQSRYTPPNTAARVQKMPVKRVIKPQSSENAAKEQAAARELQKKQAKESATMDVDPYAIVPDNVTGNMAAKVEDAQPEIDTSKTSSTSSPAVRSLMIGARTDIAIGKTSAAVSKLERGLRIESQNPELWHLLSKAHYSGSDYEQTISMAKKSNRYTNDDNLIAQNWALIKKAGEKSGNATAIKEALDYIKLNP